MLSLLKLELRTEMFEVGLRVQAAALHLRAADFPGREGLGAQGPGLQRLRAAPRETQNLGVSTRFPELGAAGGKKREVEHFVF